ncbi:MAG TPA: prepilin peptidase [Candidatus Saccharimonadales bacterium]|nr:prepilin peptidase [Candidatus Saccharimonadales bacterium]
MIALVLVVLGLIFGSFVNALVWRLHKSERKKKPELSIVSGRSVCPKCGHKLSTSDLVPVLSWFLLGGKCRYCHKPISVQYPVVELLTATVFVLSYASWPHSFNNQGVFLFILWLIFLVGFMALSLYDFLYKLLPNKIVMPLILLAIIEVIFRLSTSSHRIGYLGSELWGLVLTLGLFYGIYYVSSGKWIGGGDVKLSAILGLLLGGPALSILMIFFASILGSLSSLPPLMSGKLKRNSVIPFGPFLIISTIICYLYGVHIIDWYKNLVIT